MLFNTLNFALFLPVVFLLYWFVSGSKVKSQNILLLVASYFFYACWDWRFLFLLTFSTLLDYFTGIQMSEAKTRKMKKTWFLLSVVINLSFLGVFKYYNFFIGSFAEAFSFLGLHFNPWTIQLVLPVGISFYTFHGLSYVIDIYKEKIQAEKNFIDYSVFVCFFPLLVAGPIERATHLLPQIKKQRDFDYAKAIDGLKQILWGLFKKAVIADQCAGYANAVFNSPHDYNGSTLLIGAVFFAFQIYGDFSGYSDIAIGTAKLFGIDLLRNFAFPYFSRSIAEFWRRWHISLSSWFRDYVYIPLGGNKGSTFVRIRNVLIIFLLSGFWHGANWTFIFWGLLNAIYIIPSILLNTNRQNMNSVATGKSLPGLRELTMMLLTFLLTVFAWIFFRADNLTQAFGIISEIFSTTFFETPHIEKNPVQITTILLLFFFIGIEWIGRESEYALQNVFTTKAKAIRIGFYYILLAIVFIFAGTQQQFIYFQF